MVLFKELLYCDSKTSGMGNHTRPDVKIAEAQGELKLTNALIFGKIPLDKGPRLMGKRPPFRA